MVKRRPDLFVRVSPARLSLPRFPSADGSLPILVHRGSAQNKAPRRAFSPGGGVTDEPLGCNWFTSATIVPCFSIAYSQFVASPIPRQIWMASSCLNQCGRPQMSSSGPRLVVEQPLFFPTPSNERGWERANQSRPTRNRWQAVRISLGYRNLNSFGSAFAPKNSAANYSLFPAPCPFRKIKIFWIPDQKSSCRRLK